MLFEHFQIVRNLEKQVFDAVQILFGRGEFVERFGLSGFVFRYTRRLFEHHSAAILLVVEDFVHHAERDNRIRIWANARVHEQRRDVFQSASDAVEPILGLARSVENARDFDRRVFGRQDVFSVFKSQTDLGELPWFALFSAVENDGIHLVEPQFGRLLFTQNPTNRVHNVRFARTVGTDDAYNVFIEVNDCFVSETFKAFYFEGF